MTEAKKMQGLAAKTFMALAAASLPAIAVAIILGFMLVTAVSDAETDFNHANSASFELREMLVLIEKEHGLIVRLPAEFDLGRIDGYAREIAGIGHEFDVEIEELAAIEGIVSPDVVSEIRATRQQMKVTVDAIVDATKSFAQTTALELVNGPLEERTKVLRALLDAVASNVSGVVEHARTDLRSSSLWAWWLTPVALSGALLAVAFGIWVIRRNFVLPVTHLTDHVLRIRETGNLDIRPDSRILQRADEIGTLSRSFNLMIAELGDARGQLITQYARLDAAINNMPQGLAMFDASERLVVCNNQYIAMYGLSPDIAKPGCALREILKHRADRGHLRRDPEQYRNELLAQLSLGKKVFVLETADGREISITNQPMSNGGWVVTHEDITERRKAEAKIYHMALHDALTNLPNRRSFHEQMENRLAHLSRHQNFAVLCLDLDRFKTVNDTLGHPYGDKLLRQVAERMSGCLREGDTIARLGGDEFAILQGGVKQPDDAIALAARLVEATSAPFEFDGHQVVIGVSIGIAIAPTDAADADHLLKSADMAMYRAKTDDRGSYRFFESEMDRLLQARRALELDLRKALVKGEFEVYYQPLINLEKQEISGFEALIRWNHPERGLVAPLDFISLAEETGLIVPIGEWVLRQACAEAVKWPGEIRIAVNLSPIQFKMRNLTQMVTSALAQAGLAAQRLELEITESVLLIDSQSTLETLHQLRNLGVRISMDDFGTGYSSLSYLRCFPFDKIKIDRSFVHNLESNADSKAIIRAVTGLGSSLGISTTGEGVETQEELEYLKREGCTEAQGYFFSKPKPAHEILKLLSRPQVVAKAVA
jgi:diguanylate cyclase (GGDEF)-like protein/PAS domain S-box-containing protein